METEWTRVPLDQLTRSDAPITYGVVKPGPEVANGVLFIRGGDICDGRVMTDQLRTISHEVSEQYRRTQLQGGEIVVSLVGNPGQVAVVPDSLRGANIARQAGLIRLREDVDTRFVSYFLSSRSGQAALGAHSIGSVQQVINLRDLKTVTVPIPPLVEQRAIAHILGTLDEKIELNRRMSETLEAMARALFKSWFVDFEPVRAKAEDRDPCLPGHLAALFPERLVNSELGEIPEGWKIDDIYWCSEVIYGAPFRSALFNEEGLGRPLIRIRDLRSHDPGLWTPEVHPRGYLVQPGDLLVGMDGEFRAHLWRGPASWLNQRVCCFKPLTGIPRAFVHYSIESLLDFFERAKTGTTVIHLGKKDIDSFKVLRPPSELLDAFGRIVDPLDIRIVSAAQESRTLAEVREILLPKLLSGELRVKDPEQFLSNREAAA